MKNKASFAYSILFAIKNTYTIAISWIPVALAFGLIVRECGVPFYWAGLSGLMCPAGSVQMLIFSFFSSNATWGTILIGVAAVDFRHMFYGLSFLERFKKFGNSKQYMIYMLCDELYSVYCGIDIPKELDEKKVHLACAIVLQFYWVSLSTVFALLGSIIPFDLTGVDFALTALFAVTLIEMIMTSNTYIPIICASIIGILCLIVFGPENFMIPALLILTAALIILRKTIEPSRKETMINE